MYVEVYLVFSRDMHGANVSCEARNENINLTTSVSVTISLWSELERTKAIPDSSLTILFESSASHSGVSHIVG